MSCIFCEIVAGRAPASIVYEDDATLAFMDLIPVTPGHVLVIPKAHYRNLFDAPPAVAAQVMQVAARLAPALRQALNCAGVNVHVANEPAAGQAVWHLHFHLIPRNPGDGFGLRFPPDYGRRATYAELDELAARIRQVPLAP
jgi:histidine triad (HIT) family protein